MGRNTDISSAYDAVEIAPSDTADIPGLNLRGIMVGAEGAIKATFAGGGTVTITGLTPGQIYPFQVTRILATGTTATGIIGLR